MKNAAFPIEPFWLHAILVGKLGLVYDLL